MNHLLTINQLNRPQIEALLDKALRFKKQPYYPSYSGHPVATLFYENSTRTRVSFELAAQRLSMPVIHLPIEHSSAAKGELLPDTLANLASMGISCFVIRHPEEKVWQQLAPQLPSHCHWINAGDGTYAHPSQALLDMMTIKEHKPCLEQLKIAVIGDIKHSRVANSLQEICKILRVGELVLIAPTLWQPQDLHHGRVTDNLAEGLKEADVIVCLRVQRERLLADEQFNLTSYREQFALTSERLAYAHPKALVMHPGPINRGIEIDSEVADGPQSCILQQVTNGVYARMAIFATLLNGRETKNHAPLFT